MKAVVIDRKLSKKEIKEIESLINNEYHIFQTYDIPDYFSNRFNVVKIKEISAKEKKEINFRLMDEIINFGEIKIKGKTITDRFLFDSMSLWHYSKLNTYFTARNLLYEVNFILNLAPKYENIIYYSENQIAKIALKNNKHFEVILPESKDKNSLNYYETLKYFIVISIRIIFSYLFSPHLKNKKHILIDNAVKQKVLNIKTLKPDYSDIIFYYLYNASDDEFAVIEDINLPEKKKTFRFHVEKWMFKIKKDKAVGDHILFNALISKKVRKDYRQIFEKAKNEFNKLDTKHLNEEQKIIFNLFEHSLGTLKIFIFKYLAYRHFFNKHSFKTITTIDENSPRFKSILDAAKDSNITTIGIQHGTIHKLHPAYIYSKQDGVRKIQTDYTLVWGQYWKEFLVNEANYPDKSVKVVGQIRTDIINKLINSDICIESLKGINKKIILFASQPQRDNSLRTKTAEYVFRSVKQCQDCFLVLKLHQGEKNDFDYYDSIAKKVGIKNYKILYWEDLYLLLSKSDIVITSFSTVGAEAVYFNKPLIIIDPLKQDIQKYHKEGVAFQATNTTELIEHIKTILSKDFTLNRAAYDKFINKYAYKIDGKVSERVISFIKSLG